VTAAISYSRATVHRLSEERTDDINPSQDHEEQRRRERAAALLGGLDLGDWTGLVAAVGADLAPVYADGPRGRFYRAGPNAQ
jgi:hypothetical protein